MHFAQRPSKDQVGMMLSEYLNIERIIFVAPKDRDDALSSLCEAVALSNPKLSKQKIFQAVIEREKIVSTGIGGSVALPHAKLEELSEFVIAVAICQGPGVEWNSLDGEPVKCVFMILGPSYHQKAYLKLLSKLTILIRQERFLKALSIASKPETILKVFQQYEAV